MADENNEQQAAEAAPKKSKKKLLFAILILVVLTAGGTGGFLYWRHRSAKQLAAKAEAEKTEKHSEGGEAEVSEVIELLPFIVNLADREDPKYLRMTVSLGIGEGSSEKPDPLFTTKVRNAILAVVTTKTADQVLTVEGKTELRKEMLEAAQSAVSKPAVRAIYITDFIVQM
jgi:flagellar FliL protein